MKNILIKYTIVISIFFFIGCAKEKSESINSIQRRILDAYIEVNYPGVDIETLSNGTKVISRAEGTGAQVKKHNTVYLNLTTKSLEGNVITTTYKEVATQVGTYSKTTYYGPKLFYLGVGNTIWGLEELLYTMKVGGKVTAIIPPWVSNYEGSTQTYVNTESIIYEVEVVRIIEDIMKYQNNQLDVFAEKYYNGLDSIDAGYYFKKLNTIPNTSKDTIIKKDESVKIRYVGKLLDGFVFDTNIKDSAKVYGIYSSSNSYSALSVKYKEDYEKMATDSKIVKGFAKAISQMKYGEQAVTFFNSDWGYGFEGSGKIGGYMPLFFYIYIEPKSE